MVVSDSFTSFSIFLSISSTFLRISSFFIIKSLAHTSPFLTISSFTLNSFFPFVEDESSYEDVMRKVESVKGVEENVKQHLSGSREYTYYDPGQGEASAESFLEGIIRQVRVTVDLSEPTSENVVLLVDDSIASPEVPQLLVSQSKSSNKNITSASQLECTGTFSQFVWIVVATFSVSPGEKLCSFPVTTGSYFISVSYSVNTKLVSTESVSLLSDGTIVLYGRIGDTIKRYDIETGKELSGLELDFEPWGMAEVRFAGDPALALSNRSVFPCRFIFLCWCGCCILDAVALVETIAS